MAQHDYTIDDQVGIAFLADLNNALKALASSNSGATGPTITYPYMVWADSTAGVLKIRNAGNTGWNDVLPLNYSLMSSGVAPQANTTPTQFANDKLLATTEFVRRSGLQSNGLHALSATTTLLTSDAGKSFHLIGSGGYTVTLPLAAAIPDGSRIEIYSAVSATISRSGAESIYKNLDASGAVSSVNVGIGDMLTFVSNGSGWLLLGSVQLGSSAAFGSSIAANGYQKLPNGLIIQWGMLSDSSWVSGTSRAMVYPIAFPTAVFQVVGSLANSDLLTTALNVLHNSNSQCLALLNRTGANTVRYIAIGY